VQVTAMCCTSNFSNPVRITACCNVPDIIGASQYSDPETSTILASIIPNVFGVPCLWFTYAGFHGKSKMAALKPEFHTGLPVEISKGKKRKV